MKKHLVIIVAIAMLLMMLIGLTAFANDAEPAADIEPTANIEPSVEIEYYTVPMTATVEILYAVPMEGYEVNPDGSVDGLYLLVWKGAEGSVESAEKIQSCGFMTINGRQHLIFRYEGLGAHEMGVRAYARISYNGRLGTTKSYSVKDFAASYDGEYKSLVAALIKYGNAIELLANQPVNVEAEIVNKNGAKGVLTLISDDGDQRTSDFFYNVVAPEYDSFKITIALPTDNVANLYKTSDGKAYLIDDNGKYQLAIKSNGYNSAIAGSVFANASDYPTMVDFWKKVTDNGRIEVASHSHSHGDSWPANDDVYYKADGSVKYPAGSVIKEIRASAQILRDLIGQETPFILRPGGTFWENADSAYFYGLVETDGTFIGMRTSNGSAPTVGQTSANGAKLNTVEKFKNPESRLKIATILVRSYEAAFDETGKAFVTSSTSTKDEVLAAGVSAWEQYVDYAIQYGSWASLGFHSVTSDDSQASGYTVYDSQVLALMNYVEPLVESGDLWLASFADAAKYYFEWSSAKLTATQYGDSRIDVTLTDGETDERFDEALTVKVTVPDDWSGVRAESASGYTNLTVHTEGAESFVYVNIVPDSGTVILTPAN